MERGEGKQMTSEYRSRQVYFLSIQVAKEAKEAKKASAPGTTIGDPDSPISLNSPLASGEEEPYKDVSREG